MQFGQIKHGCDFSLEITEGRRPQAHNYLATEQVTTMAKNVVLLGKLFT